MIVFPLKVMKTQDLPTSLPAPNGVIVITSDSLVKLEESRLFNDDDCCEAIYIF